MTTAILRPAILDLSSSATVVVGALEQKLHRLPDFVIGHSKRMQ